MPIACYRIREIKRSASDDGLHMVVDFWDSEADLAGDQPPALSNAFRFPGPLRTTRLQFVRDRDGLFHRLSDDTWVTEAVAGDLTTPELETVEVAINHVTVLHDAIARYIGRANLHRSGSIDTRQPVDDGADTAGVVRRQAVQDEVGVAYTTSRTRI
jgi:hypothetical protein